MNHWPSKKARLVLSALLKLGWSIKRQSGSHTCLQGQRPCTWWAWPAFGWARSLRGSRRCCGGRVRHPLAAAGDYTSRPAGSFVGPVRASLVCVDQDEKRLSVAHRRPVGVTLPGSCLSACTVNKSEVDFASPTKYWAPVGRVDNVWGDRNLSCKLPADARVCRR
jgi:hypothetical protein